MCKQNMSYLIHLTGFQSDNNTHDYVSDECFHLHQILNSSNYGLQLFYVQYSEYILLPKGHHHITYLYVTRQYNEAAMNRRSFSIVI